MPQTGRNGTEKVTVVTREELLEKLGVDLRDCYMARLNGFPEPDSLSLFWLNAPWDEEEEDEPCGG